MEIESGEVHIWVAAISGQRPSRRGLERLLSDKERERAAAFTRDGGRIRFVTGRAILRLLLSRYLDEDPAEIELSLTPAGKPTLVEGSHPRLHFSLSHSEDLLLIAFSSTSEIGVDLEFIRPMELDAVLPLCASPSELAEMNGMTARARRKRFFELWTRKEALAKAVGLGLSLPMREIIFSSAGSSGGGELTLVSAPRVVGEPGRWQVTPLEVSDEYAAAVAMPGGEARLDLREFEG